MKRTSSNRERSEGEGSPAHADPDDREWMTPEERYGVFDVDPWTPVLDDWAEETDERFQYPVGLP